MPSVKNPNAPSKNRLAARAAKQRKTRQQAAAQGQLVRQGGAIAKADARRGARPGLLPTSGPRAAISKKKQRKLERALGHAMKRKMERDGEVVMKEAPVEKKGEEKNKTEGGEAEAEMDIE
ncbi:hypothetical protein C8A01DRAFT_34669 [Parachaetomium inaequale]|uniref:Ribosome biogenesis protein ALB1 n=1 Tax=Parachaetomium inaequale TaxID=2588326 RepID=A0AAN6SSA1_9PEZI|nr:hypothetical protein C8A01DRAFT_34669 [Parachaetomium inaequale]